MSRRKLSVRKIKEVLRLKLALGLSHRKIARSLGIGLGTVSEYHQRARDAGLRWSDVEALSGEVLEERLFPGVSESRVREVPDWADVHQQLKRKGVTKRLLWKEYREADSEGYGYSRFCDLYREFRGGLDLSMRQTHQAGERLFVDFSGLTAPIYDGHNEVAYEAEIFVGCLGASSLIFALATRSQQLVDWIDAHCRCMEALGGCTEIVVPDNLKSGVTRPCRYDPDVNRTYWDWARHYGVAVIPGRKNKARDKAKVENAVQQVQRWVLAPLRDRRFISLAKLNEAVRPLVDELNDRQMRVFGASRRELFERIDKPVLRSLPQSRFEIADWKSAKIGPDYHVDVGRHYYSVPYELATKRVEVRITASTVEVFFENRRVASHLRSNHRGGHTTVADHMPSSHRAHAKWTAERILRWISKTGPLTRQVAESILASRLHPEQGFRSCLGLIRLAERVGNERMENACRRALRVGATRYKSIESILDKGLDRLEEASEETKQQIEHPNIRGADYYRKEGS